MTHEVQMTMNDVRSTNDGLCGKWISLAAFRPPTPQGGLTKAQIRISLRPFVVFSLRHLRLMDFIFLLNFGTTPGALSKTTLISK
jgi:hypothetical protein